MLIIMILSYDEIKFKNNVILEAKKAPNPITIIINVITFKKPLFKYLNDKKFPIKPNAVRGIKKYKTRFKILGFSVNTKITADTTISALYILKATLAFVDIITKALRKKVYSA